MFSNRVFPPKKETVLTSAGRLELTLWKYGPRSLICQACDMILSLLSTEKALIHAFSLPVRPGVRPNVQIPEQCVTADQHDVCVCHRGAS